MTHRLPATQVSDEVPGRTAILIPALNCGATIGAVVSGARKHVQDVLVVSDGSTDATVAQATAAGASHGQLVRPGEFHRTRRVVDGAHTRSV